MAFQTSRVVCMILFLVSFVYMGLEMVAARLIAPYFGNTAYTWGSIITVFLIGSSLGYWWGGRSADDSTAKKWIKRYLICCAVVIAFLPSLSDFIFPILQELPNEIGTMLGATSLFIVPNVLISAIIPGITKMGLSQQFSGQRIGSYHMISSIGSIVGTLLTTFVLLPNLHVNWVLSLLVFLLLLSFCLFTGHELKRKWRMPLVLLGVCMVPLISQMKLFSDAKMIDHLTSPYHELYITERNDNKGEAGAYRFLQFHKGGYQGGMDLANPEKLIFSYTRTMIELMNAYHPSSQNVFMIGHGVGTLTHKISSMGKTIEVAEIDEKVLEVSKKYFGYTGEEVYIGDGRILLRKKDSESVDVILLDAYSGGSIPFHLTTQEFFRITQQKLKTDGILVMNVIGKASGDKLIESLYGTVANVYTSVKVYATNPQSQSLQNLIFVASSKALDSVPLQESKEIIMKRGEIISDKETRWIQLN